MRHRLYLGQPSDMKVCIEYLSYSTFLVTRLQLLSDAFAGFCEIMASLARIGFFDTEPHPMLKGPEKPTFAAFLNELLHAKNSPDNKLTGSIETDEEIMKSLVTLGHCKDKSTATRTVKTIKLVVPAFFS